jgi:hypothetical protein
MPPRYEAITPSPNALNEYQLKGLNPSKKNNECLKLEKGTCKINKRISKGKKGYGIHKP